MKKLEFKVADIEPTQTELIEVDLGGDTYVAHCPNDYEFIALQADARKMEVDPTSIDLIKIISAFFDTHDVELIDRRMRGSKPKIDLVGELIPCIHALMEYYKEQVMGRLEETQKKISAPKAG
jgi:hypothetical protein